MECFSFEKFNIICQSWENLLQYGKDSSHLLYTQYHQCVTNLKSPTPRYHQSRIRSHLAIWNMASTSAATIALIFCKKQRLFAEF